MDLKLDDYKEEILETLRGDFATIKLREFVEMLSSKGFSKVKIYNLFYAFHQAIQESNLTKDDEGLYDTLSDFMDGFTSYGSDFRILPDESDIEN